MTDPRRVGHFVPAVSTSARKAPLMQGFSLWTAGTICVALIRLFDVRWCGSGSRCPDRVG